MPFPTSGFLLLTFNFISAPAFYFLLLTFYFLFHEIFNNHSCGFCPTFTVLQFMNIQRASPVNELLAKLIFLILPTAAVCYFLLVNANQYFTILQNQAVQ